MTILALIPTLVLNASTFEEAKVTRLETKQIFAGKLGYRIEETMTVQANGKSYVLRLSNAHTRHGKISKFSEGQSVSVRGLKNGWIDRADIR